MTMKFAVIIVFPLGACAVQVVVDTVVLARRAWVMVHVREEEVYLREALLLLEARDRVVAAVVAVLLVGPHHHLRDAIQAKRSVDQTTASTTRLFVAVKVNTAMLVRRVRARGAVSAKTRSVAETERSVMLASNVLQPGVVSPQGRLTVVMERSVELGELAVRTVTTAISRRIRTKRLNTMLPLQQELPIVLR